MRDQSFDTPPTRQSGSHVQLSTGDFLPLEMHKAKVIQKIRLPRLRDRTKAIQLAGFNSYLLQSDEVYLDMLNDSGVNAMSDMQQAAMLEADNAYAGSSTFRRLHEKIVEIFQKSYFLPVHQGRAAEHLLSKAYVKTGDVVPMNHHFTTIKAHVTAMGGQVRNLLPPTSFETDGTAPFKGDLDVESLRVLIEQVGTSAIPFVRLEAGTNLIGGQPLSLANLKQVSRICRAAGIPLVLDASLLADNLYFMRTRELPDIDITIRELASDVSEQVDIIYFSARKLGFGCGGGIITDREQTYRDLRDLVVLHEGFLTYGGMSSREMEAIRVGLEETLDIEMISQGPVFIEYMTEQLKKRGVPVVTPPGGLGVHLDASRFVPHIPKTEYPGAALTAALYIASGIRGLERGTMSEQRNPDGSEKLARLELVRLAMPRRVYTLSQIQYAIDRISWLYEHRELIGGLEWVDEPSILRFFFGRLKPVDAAWPSMLADAFELSFGDSL